MPGLRRWGPLLIGRERRFAPVNEDHALLWTLRHDTQAVFTMADAVRTRAMMARWGGRWRETC